MEYVIWLLIELPTEQEHDASSTATPSTTEHVGEGAEQHEDGM